MTEADSSTVRWSELLNRQHALALALVCLSVWLHAADSLLVATMMPAIIAEIGGAHLISWTVALYEIGTIVAGAASGLLAMRYGLRLPMSLAACLFGAGCVVSAMAPEMWVVLAGRLMQGLGGGGLVALSFVATGILFPNRLLARVMAAISTLWGTSAFMGPLVGGFFVEYGTWRGGFWFFSVQAAILALWIATRIGKHTSPTDQPDQKRFPIVRLMFLSAGVVLIAYAGLQVSAISTLAFALAGLTCLALFLRFDSARDANRLLPRNAISLLNPVGAGLTMILCFTIAAIAISVYGPLLMVQLHGSSALVAGYVIACSSIGWTLAAVLISGVSARHDGRMIATGMLVLTSSIFGFAYSVPNGPVWLVAVFAGLEGIGFGMCWTFILRRATALADPGEAQRVAAAIPTIQRSGYAIGAAYVGVIANGAGFAPEASNAVNASAATSIFLWCIPFALLGLVAAGRFLATKPMPLEKMRPPQT